MQAGHSIFVCTGGGRLVPGWYGPSTVANVPCIRAMNSFAQHKLNGDSWYSPPFYTGPGGYKLQLAAAAADNGGNSHCVSIALYLMKGDNDDCLQWPFRGLVDIKLLNWTEDKNHLEHTFTTNPSPAIGPVQSFSRVVGAVRSSNGLWGKEFVAHKQLEYNPDYKTQYLMEDILCFQIIGATVLSGNLNTDSKHTYIQYNSNT